MTHNAERGSMRWLRLWGLADERLDVGLTLLTAVVLAASRFALLASGPWEWDETIFARGMLDFSLAAHFPHPPGFPGLLALGRLLLPVAGTPYAALQLLSAAASVLALWPLAVLGRRVAPPPVATAAALLVLFLPGPWLFSVRGFSTVAATAPLLAAAAMLAFGLTGCRVTWFTLLLTASFLIRPILLPTVGLLWLVGADTVRPRRKLLPGIVIGTAAVAAAVLVMVRLEGGWAAFVEPFIAHASSHVGRLDRNTHLVTELGLIKGVGGATTALVLAIVAAVGLGVWWRRVGLRAAAVWIAILGLTSAQLIMLQNRSYARYAVGVQMATAPLVAGAASLLSPPLAVGGLLGSAGLAAWSSLPLLREQHTEVFGAWQATIETADRAAARDWAAIVGPEVYVFSSYWWSVLEHRGQAAPPMLLSPRAPEPWSGVAHPWVVATVHPQLYWPSLTGGRSDFGGVSERLRPLTQGRFLTAAVIDNPPLPVGTWWPVEAQADGSPFMWAGPGAELWLPPVPAGTGVGLELRPAPGDAPLIVEVGHGGGEVTLDGRSHARLVRFRTAAGSADAPVVVRLHRAEAYPPGGGDERPLTAQLLAVMVRPPGARWRGPAATERERARLGLDIDGNYGAEVFPELGAGAWLAPKARMRLAVDEPGTVTLRIAEPRPTPAEPTARRDGEVIAEAKIVDQRQRSIEVIVDRAAVERGLLEFDLISVPYRPADDGSADSRELGVVLLGVAFEPAAPSTGWWNAPASHEGFGFGR